jgi:hypothetical protein
MAWARMVKRERGVALLEPAFEGADEDVHLGLDTVPHAIRNITPFAGTGRSDRRSRTRSARLDGPSVVKMEIVHCGGAWLTKLGRKAQRCPSIGRTVRGVSTDGARRFHRHVRTVAEALSQRSVRLAA